jgi:hypothetical protein
MNFRPLSSVQQLVSTIRENRRLDREARAAYQSLQRELATFRSPHEVDDLLGSIRNEEGPEAQQVRDILLANIR